MVLQQLLEQHKSNFGKLIAPVLTPTTVLQLNLSKHNPQLANVNTADPDALQNFINQQLKANNKQIAMGGYNEERNLYQSHHLFKQSNEEERFIHLGIDIWLPTESPVFSPLAGVIHSFANNKGVGNYGPTIIIKHQLRQTTFYSLYGHLSTASLEKVQKGQTIQKNEEIARLGDVHENGGYPPHLHFQFMADLGNYKGDYPGVSSESQRAANLANCPNPMLVLF